MASSRTFSIETIARAVLRRAGAILLCRNTKHGYLYLPGGHVEPGESAAAALARELVEEAGLAVHATSFALVAEVVFGEGRTRHHEINLVFHVELAGGRTPPARVRSREKGIDFAWADQAAVVDLDVRPRAVKAWLASGEAVDSGVQRTPGHGAISAAPAASPTAWVSDLE